MSVIFCYKQQPQPWMSYISPNKIVYPGECCPALVTDLVHLLPFQVISNGAYTKMEYSLYGEDSWTEITLPVTTVMTDGFFIHSYNGEALASELPCGVYEFRLTAGETWYFEPIMIEDFEHTENSFTARDLLMTPLKFSEQRFDTLPLIAPCDSFLPFMFTTENATNGSPTYTLVAADGTETALTITVDVLTISGRTYYIHDGACFYPFLTCGQYHIRINDGPFVYYSVPFDVECGLEDIPDGYRPMRDINGCVVRDEEGEIMIRECGEEEPVIEELNYGLLYNWYAATDPRNICSDGWHIPTYAEFYALATYLGGEAAAGGKLKEMGLIHWDNPNTAATNEAKFNGRGAGIRNANFGFPFDFVYLKQVEGFWNFDDAGIQNLPPTFAPVDCGYSSSLVYSSATIATTDGMTVFSYTPKFQGASLRPVKDTTTLSHGEEGTYTDPSGYTYRTICIGTQEWVADSIKTQHYRNGDPIPEITDVTAWAGLTSGALCAYDNDWNNV